VHAPITIERRSCVPSPCPVCAEPGGFHNDTGHAAARRQVPARLCWIPGGTPAWARQQRYGLRGDRRYPTFEDAVAAWHDRPDDDGLPVFEFLGVTWDEYKAIVEGRRPW